MTRISRISTPRATLAAFALLVVAIGGFSLLADAQAPAAALHAAADAVENRNESGRC